MIVADRKLVLLRRTRVLHFGDARGMRLAHHSRRAERDGAHVEIRVEDHRDQRLLIELQKNLVFAVVVFEQLRLANGRLVNNVLVIVILEDGERFGERDAGNEDHPHPVVNHAAGHRKRLALLLGMDLRDINSSPPKLLVIYLAFLVGQAVDAEEVPVLQIVFHLELGGVNVGIESCHGVWLQLRRLGLRCKQAGHNPCRNPRPAPFSSLNHSPPNPPFPAYGRNAR